MRNNYASILNNLKISEIMSRKVISVFENTGLDKIEKIFKEQEIHHIPVIDESLKLRGIISFADLLFFKKISDTASSDGSLKTAADIMTRNTLTVQPQDLVGKASEIFMDKNLKCLPVVDSDKNVLGIITTYDLIVLAYTDIFQNIIY